jgi:HlyD family secretion protein
MDIVRDEKFKKKKRQKQVILSVVGIGAAMLLFLAVYRLPRAAPSVDYGTIWPDTVKRGSMLRQVHGLGTLVPIPEDVRLIPAETDVRVERILVLPGTPVKPETVIMELSSPQVEQEAVNADLDLKSAEANYHNTKAKVDSDLLTLKAEAATVEDDYENAKRDADEKRELVRIGVVSTSTLKTAELKEKELDIRRKIEEDRIAENTKAVDTQLEVQKATIDQKRAMSQPGSPECCRSWATKELMLR